MHTERALLSCPGRVQDWLGAAADQIEALLQAPQPSLSGSDQAIGALRLEREGPFWMTGPYSSRSTNLVSNAFSVTGQVPPSVSSDWPLCEEKSSSRCENCVAEKGSRCSRDFPSCIRCRKNGLLCFYMEGVPTGRRKPQGRTCVQDLSVGGEPGLPVEPILAAPVLESSALLGTDGTLAVQPHRPDTYLPQDFPECAQSSLEKHSTPLVGCPTDISSGRNLMNSRYQTTVTKRQITMLPATPTFSIFPPKTSKSETAREVTAVELHSEWRNAAADGPDRSPMKET